MDLCTKICLKDVQEVPGGFFVKVGALEKGGYVIPKQSHQYYKIFSAYYQVMSETLSRDNELPPFFAFLSETQGFKPVPRLEYYRIPRFVAETIGSVDLDDYRSGQ